MISWEESSSHDVVVDQLSKIEEKLVNTNGDIGKVDMKWLHEKMSSLPHLTKEEAFVMKKLGIRLFNVGILMTQKKIGTLELNVQVRRCGCNCVSIALAITEETDEESLSTAMTFFSKCGGMWLEIGNLTMAESCFSVALEYWEKLSKCCPFPSKEEIDKRNRNLFYLYCRRASTAWEMKQADLTTTCVERAKEMLNVLPTEREYLAMMCYDWGVRCAGVHSLAAITWLKESIELYQADENRNKEKQAITLRQLANEYLLDNNLDKAFQSLTMANAESEHPSALYLLAKIEMMRHKVDHAKELIIMAISHPITTFTLALGICRSAVDCQYYDIATIGYEHTVKRFPQHADIPKVSLLQLEVLMASKKEDKAKSFIDDMILGHLSGQHVLSADIAKQLHHIIWNQGTVYFQQAAFMVCIEWFRLSEKILSPEDKVNKSKALRVISRAYLMVGDMDEAEKTALEANAIDPEGAGMNLSTCFIRQGGHYMLFKIYLQKGDISKASAELERLCQSHDFSLGHLEVSAFEALQTKNVSITIKALESLIKLITINNTGKPGHLGAIFRTLLKLLLDAKPTFKESDEINEKLSQYIKLGVQKLHQFGFTLMFNGSTEELQWIFNATWNLGLEAAQDGALERAYTLFKSSYEYAVALSNVVCQYRSLLQACTQAVEMVARLHSLNSEHMDTLKQVLKDIDQCKLCARHFVLEIDPMKATNESNADSLLFMIEFKVKALIHDSTLIQLVQRAITLRMDANTFDMMGDICAAPICKNAKVCVEAWKQSLHLRLQEPCVDYVRCSWLFRNIVMLEGKEETLVYFQGRTHSVIHLPAEVLKLVNHLKSEGLTSKYPLDNLKWMTLQAWNNGVYYFRLLRYETAERWMSVSLGLLRCCSGLEDFETEMLRAYSDVLAKVNNTESLK